MDSGKAVPGDMENEALGAEESEAFEYNEDQEQNIEPMEEALPGRKGVAKTVQVLKVERPRCTLWVLREFIS